MSKENFLPVGITEAMLSDAIAKFTKEKVKYAELPLDDDGNSNVTVLITVPSRAVIGQYRRWSDSDPKRADEILVKNCLLTSKEQVLADDGLFYACLGAIAELIPARKAIIKNL